MSFATCTVSSAYASRWSVAQSNISKAYIKKQWPKIEPCGTPGVMLNCLDNALFIDSTS